jgi:abortive infection bacteriophage resistance protein
MNTKPFKTHNQQLKILRDRGLNTPSGANRSLEQIGYYSLINGYKWSFLRRDSKGRPVHPEEFVQGADFGEIKSLYDFDKELRSILYEALLKYESMLAAELSYRFSEAHQEEHSYLAIDNFRRDQASVAAVVGTISSLSNTIKRKASTRSENAIKHYVNKHGHVPLWVLVNFLTFGDLNYLYRNFMDELQLDIAKDFTLNRKRSYNNRQLVKITPGILNATNHLVNLFRNAVAHGEITFSKKINKTPELAGLKSALKLTQAMNSQAGVYELLLSLKAVLPKSDYQHLYNDVVKLLDKYKSKFTSISFQSVLQDMNFPQNYTAINP